jgi:peroxiredoxin/uncharacterized membrane protein YphA (DoxX/SURF4 family)
MDTALLGGRLLLAAVFLIAGIAKVADRPGSRQALVDFGVPGPLAGPLGVLLPLCELAVGATLLPAASAWWSALGGLTLLLIFIAGIGLNLALGRRPDCRCFGQIASGPIGWPTLARNGMLAGAAGLVVWQGPGPELGDWIGGLTVQLEPGSALGLIAIALLVAQAFFLMLLLRQHGRLLLRVDELEARLGSGAPAAAPGTATAVGLPVGSPAPAFTLAGVYGETLTLDALRAAGKPLVLVFTDPHCGPCNGLMPDVGRWQKAHAGNLTVTVLSRGALEANRAKSVEHGLATMLVQQGDEVADAYEARATPSAVLVRQDGTIGSPVALGADAIRNLVAGVVGGPALAPSAVPAVAAQPSPNGAPAAAAPPVAAGIAVGQPAPAVKLPDLDGRGVDLADFLGSQTLVLFWNPGCGFCQQMLPDLKMWESKRRKRSPKLLVVSTGDVETNRAQGLKSPVVLDQGFIVGSAFGSNGTPMGVLIDAEGRVASHLAVGAQAVFELVNGR